MADEISLLSKLYVNLVKNTRTLGETKKIALLRKKSLNVIIQTKKGEQVRSQKRSRTFNSIFGSKKLGKVVPLNFDVQDEKSFSDEIVKCKAEDIQMKNLKGEEETEQRENSKRKFPIFKMEHINNEHKQIARSSRNFEINSEGESEDGLQTPPRLANDKHLETNEQYKKLLQFESVNIKHSEILPLQKKAAKKMEKEGVFPKKTENKTSKSHYLERKLEGLEVNLDKVVSYMNMMMEENRILKEKLKAKGDLSYIE